MAWGGPSPEGGCGQGMACWGGRGMGRAQLRGLRAQHRGQWASGLQGPAGNTSPQPAWLSGDGSFRIQEGQPDAPTQEAALEWALGAQEDRAAQGQPPGTWESVSRGDFDTSRRGGGQHLAPSTGLGHTSSDNVFNGQLQALGRAANWPEGALGSGRRAWGPHSRPAGACAGAWVWGERAPRCQPEQPGSGVWRWGQPPSSLAPLGLTVPAKEGPGAGLCGLWRLPATLLLAPQKPPQGWPAVPLCSGWKWVSGGILAWPACGQPGECNKDELGGIQGARGGVPGRAAL